MAKEYFLVKLDNVIKGNYCVAATHLKGVLEDIPFPILAEKTNTDGIYKDLISDELIYDIHFFSNMPNLHYISVTKVDSRFCYFYLKKLNEFSIFKYNKIIKEIKNYTIREVNVNNQIKEHTKKAEMYIESFIKSNSKNK